MLWVLMLVAAAAHLLPEHLAAWGFGMQAAWETVGYATEATALWLAIGSRIEWHAPRHLEALRALASWGAMEGAMRACGRLALPMTHRPPPLRAGENLFDAATGWPASNLSLVVAALVCMIAARRA